MSAAFLAVPLLLWFRPWQYRLSVGLRAAPGSCGDLLPAEPARGGAQVGHLHAAHLRHALGRAVAHQGLEFIEAVVCAAM
jgi:hypothetical protein